MSTKKQSYLWIKRALSLVMTLALVATMLPLGGLSGVSSAFADEPDASQA